MSNSKKKAPFKPIFLSRACFANGTSFKIEQVDSKGSCRVTDKNGNVSYSGTREKAWANVRYQARVSPKSEHTDGVIWARRLHDG